MAVGLVVIGFLAGMLMFVAALALSLPVWVALLAYMAGCCIATAIVAAVRASGRPTAGRPAADAESHARGAAASSASVTGSVSAQAID